jgi:hypothetical protein
MDTTHAKVAGRSPGRRVRHVALGCGTMMGFMLCAVLILAFLGRRQAVRVKVAIRQTMPTYCSRPDERLSATPRYGAPGLLGELVPFPSNEWRVSCFTTVTCQPLITVDVRKCEARVVPAFEDVYTQTLVPCP